MSDPAGLPGRLRHAMEVRGLSQGQLEKLAGLSDAYLSKIINGRRTEMSWQYVADIARALRVRAEWLTHGDGPMESDGSAADPYPALTAAASFARLSDDFPDRALLEEVLRDASGRVHHETAESTGSSDAMLKWLRRLYIVAESRRTPEGRQAELREREASAATAASRPRLVDRLPPRTKTAPKPKS